MVELATLWVFLCTLQVAHAHQQFSLSYGKFVEQTKFVVSLYVVYDLYDRPVVAWQPVEDGR